MALGSLVGRGFVRIDADTKPAEKAIKALGAIGAQGGLLALGGLVGPVTTATLSLASAFAVAGGAATAFGAAVVPQFQDISKAMAGQKVAEDARTKAAINSSIAQDLAKQNGFKYGEQVKITSGMTDKARAAAEQYNTALSASKSSSKAATQSQALYKQQLDAMPKATRHTAEAILKLKDDTQAWSRSLASSTMPIFTRGIQFLDSLLPKLSPIVRSVSREVQGFLGTLGEGDAGRVFKQFGANISKHGSGMLRTFLDITRNVIVGVVGVLNAFLPAAAGVTGGIEQMTAKFAHFGATLGKSKGFTQWLDQMRSQGPGVMKTIGQIAQALLTVVSAMGPLAGLSLKTAQAMAAILNAIPTPVLKLLAQAIVITNVALKLYALYTAAASAATWLFSEAVTTNTGVNYANRLSMVAGYTAMGIFRAALIAQRVAMVIATAAQWAWNAAMDANPIGLIVLAIGLLVAAVVVIATKTTWFQTIWKYTWNFIKDVTLAVVHWFSGPFTRFFTQTVPRIFQTVLTWVKSNWPYILGALTGPIGLAAAFIFKHWGAVRDFFVSAWKAIKRNAIDPVIHFFTVSIPNAGRAMRDAIVGFIRSLVLHVLDGFGSIIRGAVRLFGWVPGVGGKLKKAEQAFNKFRDNVNKALGDIKDRKPTVSVGMKIMSGKNAGLVNIGGIARAAGGPIKGPGTETSDDVLMWGSRDEHMWTARETRAVGGHGAMLRLRKMALMGLLKGYRNGGAVEPRPRTPSARQINSGVNTGFGNLLKANVWTLIKAFKEALAASAGPSFIGLGGVGKSALSAMNYAQSLLKAHVYGWGMGQWPAWRSLGMGESGWRWNALNHSSGAYGIPQALPAGKMRSAGADWRTNAFTQVRWMASYMHSVYGSPAHAWSRWLGRSPHWYDQGGWLMPGLTMAYNGTGRPERVSPPGHAGTGAVVIERLVLENHGVIGSRNEVENWLVSTFSQLQRQGRIKVVQ